MLDKNEMILVSRLRENARESLTRMSRRTSIPVTTLYSKLKILEKKIIRKYAALVDFASLGYSTRAILIVRVKKEFKDKLKEFLLENRSVNSLYRINNGYDFMIEIISKEIGDVEFFVEQLENDFKIDKKEVYYIIDEINRESFMSKYEYVKLTGNI